ncbi:MAG: hypothetical protein QHH18_07390 [Candidatus Bathyarchaeota archaeon]|jgi:hypothetical protein|nr:hypothetical protein [Candidatus Bathyarchaeota archaeon A05DMB-5]MDH7558405.1 hypothetical protein [Candidatus Bathyarchaeota archaeon]
MKRSTRKKKHAWKKVLRSKWMALTVVSILAGLLIYYFFIPKAPAVYEAVPKTAAIVDQLAITHSNVAFVTSVNETLTSAGFSVDYYNYSEVTVDFYKQLPSKRYSLIILRVHSGVGQYSGLTSLYTSEPHSQWPHYWEQMNDEVVAVEYVSGGPIYFAITSKFVRNSDACKNSIIIMMGCDGLTATDMASAYVEKGAKAYISWNGPVSPGHTDTATSELIRNLVLKNQTIADAVNNTMNVVGSDPNYHSQLAFYPTTSSNYTLLNSPGTAEKPHLAYIVTGYAKKRIK